MHNTKSDTDTFMKYISLINKIINTYYLVMKDKINFIIIRKYYSANTLKY